MQNNQLKVILTDVTESTIVKSQITVDKESKRIISTDFSKRKIHDFKLLKRSNATIHPDIKSINDSGYQGLQKMHTNTELPKKKQRVFTF